MSNDWNGHCSFNGCQEGMNWASLPGNKYIQKPQKFYLGEDKRYLSRNVIMEIKKDIIVKGAIKQIVIFILAAVVGYLIIWHLPRIMTFIATIFGQQ